MSRMLDRQEGPFALIEGQMQRCLFLLGIHAKEIKKPQIWNVKTDRDNYCGTWKRGRMPELVHHKFHGTGEKNEKILKAETVRRKWILFIPSQKENSSNDEQNTGEFRSFPLP